MPPKKISLLTDRFILFSIAVSVLLSACNPQDGRDIALGTIERERIALTATADEIIVDLPIKEGSQVNKGQLLVQLDPREQQAIVQKAAADIAEKQATLTKLENGARSEDIAAARAKLRETEATLGFANKTLRRYTQLVKEKTVAQSTFDKALTAQEAAAANHDNAREQLLELTNGTRPEDLELAAAQLDAAKAVYNAEKQRLSNLSVVATRDGLLDNLPWNLGERVSKGTPVAVLLSNAAPFVYSYIPENPPRQNF